MVKTEQLQPPQGDHHFGFRNNRLVINCLQLIFSRAHGLKTNIVFFVCIFERSLSHRIFVVRQGFCKVKRANFTYVFWT